MPEEYAASKVPRRSARKYGFLMLALVLLGGLAGLSWPMLRHAVRRYSEDKAFAALREYCNAQSAYRNKDWSRDGILRYAETLQELADADLIPAGMAAARGPNGKPYNGYLFLEMATIAGGAYESRHDFALCAIPAEYGETGCRSYIVCTNGLVLSRDQGPGGTFCEDFPAAPREEWRQ